MERSHDPQQLIVTDGILSVGRGGESAGRGRVVLECNPPAATCIVSLPSSEEGKINHLGSSSVPTSIVCSAMDSQIFYQPPGPAPTSCKRPPRLVTTPYNESDKVLDMVESTGVRDPTWRDRRLGQQRASGDGGPVAQGTCTEQCDNYGG
jgi:hypothetical protein